jgi:hypothetical protein
MTTTTTTQNGNTTMSTFQSGITMLEGYNGNQLAYLADCASPDNATSNGARYLATVRNNAIEAIRYNVENGEDQDVSDMMHEVVCVPIYTHDLWTTFVDLAAYNVDIEDYEPTLENYPQVALYVIGITLAQAIVTELGLA